MSGNRNQHAVFVRWLGATLMVLRWAHAAAA